MRPVPLLIALVSFALVLVVADSVLGQAGEDVSLVLSRLAVDCRKRKKKKRAQDASVLLSNYQLLYKKR
jgi:hypothetical protein